jgi:glycosyltransferase involved in cell wall biosynthesis
MPQVSVIIPAYNSAETIVRTLESVLHQTHKDFEIVVIDDGSTDDTAARVQAVGDARIRLLSYPNGGLPTARNRGIAAASGEYLGFLDADDLWGRTKLESHVALLQNRAGVGVVYSWTCTIDDEDRILGQQHSVSWEGDVYRHLLQAFFVGNASNAIIRRDVVDSVGPFDTNLDCGEDWEFLLRTTSRCRWAVVPEYLVFYRWREGSISSDAGLMRAGLLKLVDRMFESAPPELQSLKPRSLANVHVYIARTYLTRYNDRPALREAARSLVAAMRSQPRILLDPVTFRLCLRWLLATLLTPQHAKAVSGWYNRARGERAVLAGPWA